MVRLEVETVIQYGFCGLRECRTGLKTPDPSKYWTMQRILVLL